MPSPRPQLRYPTYQAITQGTVFSCARALRYENCNVNGLVITSRCDVAQRKYPVLNYLPIVRLPDWLRRDGLDILKETENKRQSSDLFHFLHNNNISNSITSSISLDRIAEVHFPTEKGTSTQKKVARNFRAHISLMKEFSNISGDSPDNLYQWFCNSRPSEVKDLIQRLSRHSVLGHYFFESLDPDTSCSQGFVCLLREVVTLPRPIAECLGRGISAEECLTLCGESYALGLSFDHDDLAMPVVEIGSPTIEHIIQSFSNLFGRIGVPDPTEDDIAMIVCRNVANQRSTS